MRNLRNSKGFTLIELMIVVVIIGILAAIAIPKFGAASDRAKEKEADGILKQIYTLQNAYFAQHGVYADTDAELISVGWTRPTADQLQNYQEPTLVDLGTASQCLTKDPATASHSTRCINRDGILTSQAATP